MKFISRGGMLSANLTASPVQWLSLIYQGKFGRNEGRIISGERFSIIHSYTNSLDLIFFLLKDLSLDVNYEYYYNSASLENKSLSFTDLGVSYVWGRIRFSFDWSNVFDTNTYLTDYYDNINAYKYAYNIRPASILLKARLKLRKRSIVSNLFLNFVDAIVLNHGRNDGEQSCDKLIY
jgi:hypothetical protein